MKNSLLAITLALLSVTTAYAAAPKANGFYFGGVAGFSNLDSDGLEKDLDSVQNTTSASWGIYGGYKFLKYLAVEGRFTYLGLAKFTTGEYSAKIKPTALTANLVGILPLGESGAEIFGQVGVGGVFVDDNFSSVGLTSLDNEATGTVGLGIRTYVTETVALSFQYDVYGWEAKVQDKKYDLLAGTALFGLQWMF